ncbi:MAG: hemerythrin family protein [Nitrospinae bacterium]|nr:hemerythrin family protein [Nitrospinota bacterium]
MYIQWSSSYRAGVDNFDRQHKILFDIMNDFHSRIISGHSGDSLLPTLNELASYAATHFSLEEKAMAAAGYAGLEAHKKEHALFRSEVIGCLSDHMNGVKVMPLDLLRFISEWLKNHIMKRDIEYGACLSSGQTQRHAMSGRETGV